MTDETKLALVQSMTDETSTDVISAFLSMAGDAVCNYVDPYKSCKPEDILDRYSGVQVRVAAYFLNKRGADGELTHSENGVARTYEAGDIPASLLRELVPMCGVIS